MPAVKTNSPGKRHAPKAKGSIRAKSGCYTCRIRRKKCDEQPDDAGACQTCNRLRLECLGFGAKRPEWLRESRNVSELREKIKVFLAAQGMIKGHSGTGPRGPEREQPTLRLNEDYSESSASPPTPTLSLTSDVIRHHHHNLSSMRDDHWMEPAYGQSSLFPNPAMRDISPFSSHGSAHDPPYPVDNSLSPAMASSFSGLYTFSFPEDMFDQCDVQSTFPRNPDVRIISSDMLDRMVQHYVQNVVSVQYLLADDAIRNWICDMVSSHERSREAATLLASIHWKRFTEPQAIAFQSEETQTRLRKLNEMFTHQAFATGDAMAALHVVSSFLFDGGSGEWHRWLNVACQYVDDLFRRYGSAIDALLNCTTKDAFIIKTTIWFDVLGAVTTQKSPYFLSDIRLMFGPSQGAKITEVSSEDQSSMMSPMGCHNDVVWALAEISELSAWKQQQQLAGCLSTPVLVRRGMAIDECLTPPPSEIYASSDISGSRILAAEIFRASARLYLRSVLSGDYPQVPEIAESLEDTINCIKRLSYPPADTVVNGQTMCRSVVRNTVFSFFICGAFAERDDHRNYIQGLLEREGNGAGNCGTIQNLLKTLWAARDEHRNRRLHGRAPPPPVAVDWRGQLSKYQILLV